MYAAIYADAVRRTRGPPPELRSMTGSTLPHMACRERITQLTLGPYKASLKLVYCWFKTRRRLLSPRVSSLLSRKGSGRLSFTVPIFHLHMLEPTMATPKKPNFLIIVADGQC